MLVFATVLTFFRLVPQHFLLPLFHNLLQVYPLQCHDNMVCVSHHDVWLQIQLAIEFLSDSAAEIVREPALIPF